MADINVTQTEVRPNVFRWTAILGANDKTAPIQFPALADKTVQVTGTFSGAQALVEGSCVETPTTDAEYNTLRDSAGNLLTFTSSGCETIVQVVPHLRVRLSGGDVNTAVKIVVIGRAT